MNEKNDRASWIKGGKAECSIPAKPRAIPATSCPAGRARRRQGHAGRTCSARAWACASFPRAMCSAPPNVCARGRAHSGHQRCAGLHAARRFGARNDRAEPHPRTHPLPPLSGRLSAGWLSAHRPASRGAETSCWRASDIRIEAVLNYTLPIATIVARLSGRRTCSSCKSVFHVSARPPRVTDICDHCGGQLVQREDDRPEAVQVRMAAYEHSTKPLIEYYADHGLVRTISAEGEPERIYERTLAVLDA